MVCYISYICNSFGTSKTFLICNPSFLFFFYTCKLQVLLWSGYSLLVFFIVIRHKGSTQPGWLAGMWVKNKVPLMLDKMISARSKTVFSRRWITDLIYQTKPGFITIISMTSWYDIDSGEINLLDTILGIHVKSPSFFFSSSLPPSLSPFMAKIIGIMVPWKRDGYLHDLIELKYVN